MKRWTPFLLGMLLTWSIFNLFTPSQVRNILILICVVLITIEDFIKNIKNENY